MPVNITAVERMTTAQLAQIPAQASPSGIIPNFKDPATRDAEFYGATGILLVLSSIAYLIRVYMKVFQARQIWIDDVTLTLGFLLAIFNFVAIYMGGHYGSIGKHYYEVHLDAAFSPWNIFCIIATQSAAIPALGLIKITFLFQYWVVFSTAKWVRIGIYIGVTIISLFYIPVSIAVIVMSSPWPGESAARGLMSWHFAKAAEFAVPAAYMGIFTDWYILLLPLPMLYKLRIPFKRKLGILLMVMTGLLAATASIVSMIYRLDYQGIYKDSTWNIIPIFMWTMIEMFAGVLAVCMPNVYNFYRRYISQDDDDDGDNNDDSSSYGRSNLRRQFRDLEIGRAATITTVGGKGQEDGGKSVSKVIERPRSTMDNWSLPDKVSSEITILPILLRPMRKNPDGNWEYTRYTGSDNGK